MSSRILKITLSIMAASMVCKITGLIREVSLASYLGISKYTDAYLIASAIPLEIFNIIFASVGIIFLPLYIEALEREGKQKADFYMNNLINLIILISIVVCVSGMVLAKPLVKLMAIGFSNDLIIITATYMRIMLPAIITLGISNLISAYLQASNNFILPAIILAPTNIIITISIFICIYFDSTILAYGTLLGLISQLFILIPMAYKKGYRYQFIIKFDDEKLLSTIKMIIPVILGASVKEMNVFVDRIIATTIFVGSVATLNFAHKIDLLIFGVFSLSFSTVIYRKLSEWSAKDKMQNFSETLAKSIAMLTILLIPMTIITMLQSELIVEIIYKRGNFNDNAVAITSVTLYFYAIGIFGCGIREILGKSFYSIKDTKTPMINGIVAVFINIILSLLLAKSMGIGGIALASSIASIFTTILLLINISKKLPNFRLDIVVYTIIKTLLSSIIGGILMIRIGIFSSFLFAHNIKGQLLSLSFNVAIFMIIYISLLKVMQVKELDLIIKSTKEFVRNIST